MDIEELWALASRDRVFTQHQYCLRINEDTELKNGRFETFCGLYILGGILRDDPDFDLTGLYRSKAKTALENGNLTVKARWTVPNDGTYVDLDILANAFPAKSLVAIICEDAAGELLFHLRSPADAVGPRNDPKRSQVSAICRCDQFDTEEEFLAMYGTVGN